MAFRELDYQARALTALDDWLERLAEERDNAEKVLALRAANPGIEIPIPDFPARAWERLATDKGVPTGKDGMPRAFSPRLSGDGGPPWPMVKASMGNAMRIVRPVVIMDEGQKAVSDLAFRTLYGFNPALVLELTATPKDVRDRPGKPGRNANILVEITGRELEREGMIKMPMNVAPLPGGEWQRSLGKAWKKLEELDAEAIAYRGDGGRYIRPIMLVQVERTGKEQADAGFIHADHAYAWLKSVAGLDDEEIAYKTAERNDLDKPENSNLLSPKCRVRAIITKAALAEGWDCPFAYVLCALAANGNESAMTQLVGRILRQPHAEKTGVATLDECYVYAHRADTKATVDAIRKALEGDGLGDLAMDIALGGGGTGSAGGGARRIHRRDTFRQLAISLPQVLTVEGGGGARLFDAETDLFPMIDWRMLDVAALAARLPKERLGEDHRLIRLTAGDHGVDTIGEAAALPALTDFDAGYAVRVIADLVPNAFTAWALIDDLTSKLKALGWADTLIGKLGSFIIDELRKELAAERERQAAALFAAGLDAGTIRFELRGDEHDWSAPFELSTNLPENADQLTGGTGAALERSLFLPIYKAELNDEEQEVAVYLDRESVVRWWHRNGTTRRSYGLRGWRRGNIYPDFLLAATRDEASRERVVVLETKGVHLSGNADTEYKRALLDRLTRAFAANPAHQPGGLAFPARPFDFRAALVVFSNVEAELPAMIHKD